MDFPHKISASDKDIAHLCQFVSDKREELIGRIKQHGAVLLRGWNPSVREFSRVAHKLGPVLTDISCSAGPRIEVESGVYTANEAPPSEQIPFHHEMAQCPSAPEFVLFYCDIVPTSRGATPIIHSKRLAAELKRSYPQVAARIRDRGIRYVREFPAETDMTSPLGKSWRTTFNATCRAQAESELKRQGFDWEWLAEDRLKTIGPITPMFVHRNGDDMLFTAAESVFLEHARVNRPEKSFIYGDGRPLDDEAKNAFIALGKFAFQECTATQWQYGDVLIIDSETVMHAREAFLPPRRILVSLVGCIPNTYDKKIT